MRVEDVMTRAIQTISADASADEAWNLMRAQRIHHLVVTEGPRTVGILSDRDAGGARGASVRKNRAVRELMTTHVVTVPPTTTIRKAASTRRLLQHRMPHRKLHRGGAAW